MSNSVILRLSYKSFRLNFISVHSLEAKDCSENIGLIVLGYSEEGIACYP